MITEFTRPVLHVASTNLLAAVSKFAAENGLNVRNAGGTYDAGKWTEKLEFTVQQTADGKSGEAAAFERDCHFCLSRSITPAHYGKTFRSGGHFYKLVAVKPGGSRFDLVAERVPDGRRFKFNSHDVTPKLVAAGAF